MDKELVKLIEKFCGTRAAKKAARILEKHKKVTVTILYRPEEAISAINETDVYHAEIVPSGKVIRIRRKPRPRKHKA